MGMFDKIATVSRQFDSNYLRQGRYIIRLEEVKSGRGRKGEHWRLSAMVIAVLDDDEGKGHRLGEVVKRLRPESQDGSLSEFKSLVCTLYECDEDEVGLDETLEIIGPNQPLAGAVVEVRATTGETKASLPTDPKFFTRVDYVRRIPNEEVLAVIGPEAYAKFFTKSA